MDVNFSHTAAGSADPVVFERILGEKPGGGIVANPTFDLAPGTAIALDSDAFKPIKAYRLLKAVAAEDTTIEIAKGSGVAIGDVIGNGKKAVACTNLDSTNATKDVVTVTLAKVVATGTVLFQAAAAHATAAVPIYIPKYFLGSWVYAGKGDQTAKLVNIANVRKETVNASLEVIALLPTINAV
ncbi:MAG: hypothetical protein NTZ69_16015 [Bacteroidia bacterium]|nr:hypothetical protein [Bacteroidia bacterium]